MKLKTILLLALTLLLVTLTFKKCHPCEFLVCARTDVKDIYGYVVTIKDDHAKWGDMECMPQFYLIISRGMSIEEGRKYLQVTDSKDPTIGISYWFKDNLVEKENLDTIKKEGKIYFLKEGIEQCFSKQIETISK
jgi:hypothetical protein